MSQFITLDQAVDMTSLYRSERNTILASNYQDQNILATCESFGRDVFDKVLAQEGCEGIRIYYGMDGEFKVHAIVVGVDGENKDMLPPTTNAIMEEEPGIIENGSRCPEECPEPSPLNP